MTPHQSEPAALEHEALPQAATGADKNGSPPDQRGQEGDAEECTYEPVGPRKTVSISVRYHVRGRGRPLPFTVDEGESA